MTNAQHGTNKDRICDQKWNGIVGPQNRSKITLPPSLPRSAFGVPRWWHRCCAADDAPSRDFDGSGRAPHSPQRRLIRGGGSDKLIEQVSVGPTSFEAIRTFKKCQANFLKPVRPKIIEVQYVQKFILNISAFYFFEYQ